MHAGASAAAWTCGDSVAITEVEATASALAKAAAVAVSYAYADCAADEGGWLCVDAGTLISGWVVAVVRSWASAWVLLVRTHARTLALWRSKLWWKLWPTFWWTQQPAHITLCVATVRLYLYTFCHHYVRCLCTEFTLNYTKLYLCGDGAPLPSHLLV
jgi:hypothetical protein